MAITKAGIFGAIAGTAALGLFVKVMHAVEVSRTVYEEALPKSSDPGRLYLVAEFETCNAKFPVDFEARACQDAAAADYREAEKKAHEKAYPAIIHDWATWPIG